MKLLIIRSKEQSSWGSCKVISPNLQSLYYKLPSDHFDIIWFDLPIKYLKEEGEFVNSPLIDLSLTIKKEKPDRIVFVDHHPSPAEILNNLTLIFEFEELPPILIHTYGDFTYFSDDWLKLSPKMLNHKIKFLTASEAQKKLLACFCEDQLSIEKFCFPVDSSQFFFDSNSRKDLRSQMNIGDQEVVILYSGRVSLQKNVDLLITNYLRMLKNIKGSIHLWIVGAFDDVGAPFMGVDTNEGYLYSKLDKILSSYPKDSISKIKFWGLQDKISLRKIQSSADIYISLSLYHDEDYGMSPAEAMACGLPALLTDWGGYSSFASSKWRCQLIPVSISEFGLQIKTSVIQDFIETYQESYIDEKDRQRWSSEFLKEFSIDPNSTKLENIIKSPIATFKGFNWMLAPFSLQYGKSARNNVVSHDVAPSSKNLYYQVYQNYISLKQEDANTKSYETIQWMYDYVKNVETNLINITKRKNRSYHHYLNPFSKNYYSPMGTALLLDGEITTKLTEKSIWIARDGITSLVYFFKKYLPEAFMGKLAIHKDLWFVVPEQWKDKILFYELKTNAEYGETNLPEKIFITGMFNSMFTSVDDLEQALLNLNRFLGEKRKHEISIWAYFPSKENNITSSWHEDDFSKYSDILHKNFPGKINFLDWRGVLSEVDFKKCLYLEVNHGYFIHDSYVRHFALSRGAGLLKNQSDDCIGDVIQIYNLSLNHSLVLYQAAFPENVQYKNPIDSEYFEYFKHIFEKSVSRKGAGTSWDTWMDLYLKKYYKLNPPSLT